MRVLLPLLPEPSLDAQHTSRQLQERILKEIAEHNGWMPFSRYMDRILYTPGWGYYSGGMTKLGKDGDFTTAPEISPLFGMTLAHAILRIISEPSLPSLQLMEFGAGSGQLACDVLTALEAAGEVVDAYLIVELSATLRERQQVTLQRFPQVRWCDRLPAHFSGVVIGNEVLDAMPVDLVVRRHGTWYERGVCVQKDSSSFAWSDRPADAALLAHIQTHLPRADDLQEGYVTEVHRTALGFMRTVAQMLDEGSVALFVDYGFPAAEYYLPQRHLGTLMCHYRHHAHPDPFYWPGLQDVTAHVNFTAMAQAAMAGGADLLGYTSQAAFLLNAGIDQCLARTSVQDTQRYLPQANAVNTLLSPAEMGELFKVLVIGKGGALPAVLMPHDRCGRL